MIFGYGADHEGLVVFEGGFVSFADVEGGGVGSFRVRVGLEGFEHV